MPTKWQYSTRARILIWLDINMVIKMEYATNNKQQEQTCVVLFHN